MIVEEHEVVEVQQYLIWVCEVGRRRWRGVSGLNDVESTSIHLSATPSARYLAARVSRLLTRCFLLSALSAAFEGPLLFRLHLATKMSGGAPGMTLPWTRQAMPFPPHPSV